MTFRILWPLLFAFALVGCEGQPWRGFPASANPEHVWPGPPAPARVAFVMEIREHRDLFTEAGGWRQVKRWFTGPAQSQMVRPFALALHPGGGLLVADPGRNVVHFYDWTNRRYAAFGEERDGGLPSPVGVSALPGGDVLICDSVLARIERYAPDGEYLGTFAATAGLERPAGIAVDAARSEIYVADVTAHRIAALDLDGNLMRWIGGHGAGPGQFNFPTHLALSPDGLIAVTDSMNFRAQLLRPDGTFVAGFGELGQSPGQFSKPKGVAVDSSGRVVVVEGLYDALNFFSPEGDFLLSLGSPGAGPGQFWLPGGLCFDRSQNLLFVADSFNRRVQVFRMLEDGLP